MSRIQGVRYGRTATEYQYFPEEYFSGSDINIYFGDLLMDEIMGLSFGLRENVLGVYGYNSFTYDRASRGQRIVQGTFSIAFKEAGYMYRVLEHVAQMGKNARPALAYKIMKEKKPQWVGNPTETIEGLMKRSGKVVEGEMADYETRIWGDPSKDSKYSSEDTYFYGSDAQQYLAENGFDIYINYGELPHAAAQSAVQDSYTFHATAKALRGVQLTDVQQILGANGEPIAEQYNFIAQDLD